MARTRTGTNPTPTEWRRHLMYAHSSDNLKDETGPRRALINRSFWVHDLPRLVPLCRAFGHRPVVDGSGTPGERGYIARWVCCDRCGVRPEPQGNLDANVWQVGQRYTGAYDAAPDNEGLPAGDRAKAMKSARTGFHPPGSWPGQPTGDIGGQLVIGKTSKGFSAAVEVGAAGSEDDLSCHLSINPIGALYLHTSGFGAWLQRRLIPEGYEDRVVDISVHNGTVHWRMWATRDSWTKGTSRWRDGSARIDPRDVLLGERRYTYEPHGEPVTATVRMPEGDDHEVTLTLKRQRHGRRKGRGTFSWTVSWDSKDGIPFRNHDWKGDCVYGSAVQVTSSAVETGRWPQDACAAIAARISEDRSGHGWRPRAAA